MLGAEARKFRCYKLNTFWQNFAHIYDIDDKNI